MQSTNTQDFNKENWKSFETEDERNEFFYEWKTKDSTEIEKKTQLKPKNRKVLSKIYKDLSFTDKMRYRRAERRLERKFKKMYRKDIRRFKKTIRWSAPDKKYSKSGMSGMEKEQKIKYLRQTSIWNSRKEALKKQKVKTRFNKKELRLRKRYALSPEEKIVLNKALGKRLDPDEKRTFSKAKRKQVVFTKKLTKLRKRRHFKLQNKEGKKRLRKKSQKLHARDYYVKKNRERRAKRDKDKN